MSTLDIEPAGENMSPSFSAEIIRVVAAGEFAAVPRPALGTPHATQLSGELSSVIAGWLGRAPWRQGILPPRPGYRRHTPFRNVE